MATFKTTSKDNTEVEVIIAGARATASNLDISSTVYANYDNDTSNTYRLAEITVRDHFGSTNSNGFGDLIFRTNGSGLLGTSIENRMVILYNGNVGINKMEPSYTLDVDGTANVSNLLIQGKVVNAGRQPVVSGFTPITVTESNVYTKVFSYIIKPTLSGIPSQVDVSAFLQPKAGENTSSSNFTYNLRAIDFTNNKVLGFQVRSNESVLINSFTLSNVSTSNTFVLELQTKKNQGGTQVVIDAVNVLF